LSILLESSLLAGEPLVVFIGKSYRADLGALCAAGALGQIDVAGLTQNLSFEAPLFPLKFQKLAVREKLYVQMPADLDQFGGDNSHRAVVGGEGLVQLGHHSADGGRLFHEMHKESGVGKIQRCLHSGDTPTDNQHRTTDVISHLKTPWIMYWDR
jgi:hypothetical protein